MATILDKENITNAKTAVNNYRQSCTTLESELNTLIADLRKSYFIGDASDGFNSFYTKISPALTTNLYGPQNSVTAMLDELLDAIQNALIGKVDPELGTANHNAANNTNTTANVAGAAANAANVETN